MATLRVMYMRLNPLVKGDTWLLHMLSVEFSLSLKMILNLGG